jgi:hypothetical protein
VSHPPPAPAGAITSMERSGSHSPSALTDPFWTGREQPVIKMRPNVISTINRFRNTSASLPFFNHFTGCSHFCNRFQFKVLSVLFAFYVHKVHKKAVLKKIPPFQKPL